MFANLHLRQTRAYNMTQRILFYFILIFNSYIFINYSSINLPAMNTGRKRSIIKVNSLHPWYKAES